jgi:chitodextrinase
MRRTTSFRSLAVLLVLAVAGVVGVVTPGTSSDAAVALAVDKQVTTHQAAAASSITSPTFTTSQSNELLIAFITSDGPSGAKQTFASVTGGSLTWRLRQRTNAQAGTAEIWQAVAPNVLTNASVKATRSSGSYVGSITVTTFVGASTTVDGAVVSASAATGAPSATLSTTRPGSWVWGAGNDWDKSASRTVGPNQTKVDEFLAAVGDTFWVQRQSAPTPATGITAVTINDTAPTTDRWNLSLIEIAPAVVDTTPPSTPTGVSATAISQTRVDLAWSASVDDIAVTGYDILRNGTKIATSATTTFSDTTVAAGTTYSYSVDAYDAAGNISASSAPATVSTPAADTTPPTITSVSAGSIAQTAATISWATDEASTTQVEYGTTTSYGSQTSLVAGLVTAHSQNLSNLTASTLYHYRVKSSDAAGNQAVSADNTFTTADPAPDTTAPVVSLTAPVNNATVSATVSVTATATDNVGVVGVQFTRDGTNLGVEDTAAPYSSSWDTKTAPNGPHTLAAIARDAAGNTTTSVVVNVTVNNDVTAPVVNVTSPTGGATVSGTTSISANATDNVSVAGVQFKVDGANLGTEDTSSPYSVQWDTTLISNGTHALTAVARDGSGNSTTSAAISVTVSNTSASDPSVVGQWAAPFAYPEVSIHAALTNTGKVLTFQGDFAQGGQQYVYDPNNGSITQVPTAAADLFCAGQAVAADGRILVLGGTATSGGLGIKAVTAFSPATQTWQTLAPMNHARWYATGTTLADGRILSTSGYDKSSADLMTIPEVYDVKNDAWTDLSSASQSIPVYPFMYQLPDGRVLQAGASETATTTKVLNIATQTWSTVDSRIIDGASIVNYAPGKFMKAGSASDSGNPNIASASTAFTLDMNQPNPTWQPTGSMAYRRSFVNLTSLSDGTVLATGGESTQDGMTLANAVKPAEIWNPATGTWTTVSAMQTPRLYHSVAVLLPDGRVMVSGSGGDSGVPDELSAEIYSPPYLFKGPRPTITAAPGTVQYNSPAFVQTPDAANITSVSLIRTGSVTHSFDQNARAIPLSFTPAPGGLNVSMPANGNTAPPGYYLLSIVTAQGVPSTSAMVRLPAPYEDTVAPSAPGALTATGAVGSASLAWTAATDNVGVTSYNIYRSTSPGFTPAPANRVGQSSTVSFTDKTVTSGAYYYQVTAQDAAGNVGPASNEASALVTADTVPPSAATNLVASSVSAGSVGLSWTDATDNVAVAGYRILRNGVQIGSATSGASYTDATVAPNTTYSYAVAAYDAAGNTGPSSNVISVTTGAAALAMDAQVTTHQSSSATSISSPPLSTTGSNELLVAFVSSDGPASGASFSSVTGGGLTWRLRKRANGQGGVVEIWQAVAPAPLANVVVAATRSSGSYQGTLNVVAFKGANTAIDGATGGGSATSGAPSATLATTAAGSWVWGVGNDWSNAVARVVGPSQTKVDEYLGSTGDTYWVQRQTSQTPGSGTVVTINDTAPTSDMWNLALIEIRSQ